MNFDFSDEQRQLRDAVESYLAKEYSFERYRAIERSAAGWDPKVWRDLAELGVLAVNVPAAQGGLGYGPLETLALMDVCGPRLLLEPLLSSAVIATAVLRGFADDTSAAELLRGLSNGERIAALAHFERDGRFETRWVSSRARRSGEGYRLDGHKAVVLHAGAADTLLVSARTSGQTGDAHGVTLFRVPHDAPGLGLDIYPTVGGQSRDRAGLPLRRAAVGAVARRHGNDR